jgi:hypothetical protein
MEGWNAIRITDPVEKRFPRARGREQKSEFAAFSQGSVS